MNQNVPEVVVIHPLVLLSIVDHYNRVVGKTKNNQRVVGVLLGEWNKRTLDITNCYAIPFEEDPKENHIWFIDHIYHENMYAMFKKINAREKVVGWYTTGTKFKSHDIEINEIFKKYCTNPMLVLIDVENKDQLGLPTNAYYSQEEVTREGSIIKNFVHVPSTVEAFEPEEVGVEQLLRDIKDVTISSLSTQIQQNITSLKGLVNKMIIIKKYLDDVVQGKKQPNIQIIYNLQEMFNSLPNTNSVELTRAFLTKNNDNTFVLYICSIIRSIISLHNLINNKLQNKESEKIDADKINEKEKEKHTEKADEKKDNKTTSSK